MTCCCTPGTSSGKHARYSAKGSAPLTRADISRPAAQSGFQHATQLLRPFRVNTEVAIVQPCPSNSAFEASFLPPSNDYQIAGKAFSSFWILSARRAATAGIAAVSCKCANGFDDYWFFCRLRRATEQSMQRLCGGAMAGGLRKRHQNQSVQCQDRP